MENRKLLRGALVYAKELNELCCVKNGFIAVNNGVVEASGEFSNMPKAYQNAQILDYSDCIITPSFVDMHLHAPQYPMLGMGMDLPLLDWLNAYTFKTEAKYKNEAFARESYASLARELIARGTTRVVMFSSIHVPATLILMEELEKAGISGYVGKVNMDRNSSEDYIEATKDSLLATRLFIQEAQAHFKNLKPIITPRFTPSCTDELMSGLGELAKEYELPVQSHLTENVTEIEWVKELCPTLEQYWETYDACGLWKENTVMAHCVHSDARERAAIKRAGVMVAHCPDSNTNIYSGIAPIRKMLQEGIRVGLGTDIAGGASLSMMNSVAAAVRVSKLRYYYSGFDESERFLTLCEAFYLATTAGQEYFGCKPGFEAGKPLHALVLSEKRLSEPVRELTLPERLERLIYADDDRNIIARFADGREIK